MVDWDLNGEGSVLQTTDQIAQYHDDGMGFGVLVKLYSMAAVYQGACGDQVVEQAGDDPAETLCGVTVEELVQAFQSGMGMGQLFKMYGKPAHLGVGHIRKAAAQMDAADPGEEEVTAGEGESSAYFFTTKGNKNKPKNSGNPFTSGDSAGQWQWKRQRQW